MVRLYLFAEGQAEQTFANTVLCPHLAQRGVYLHKAVPVANSHKKHRTHRGGIRNFQAMQKDITRFLRQHSGNDVFFTSMIDLYRLPEDFPGFKKADKRRSDPYGRVRMLEKRWAKETGDHRFVPHIQLHEAEPPRPDDRAEGDVGDQPFVLTRICARGRVVRNRKASNIGC